MADISNQLQVNPDVVQHLVDLARLYHAREITGIPEDPEAPAGSAEAAALSDQEFDRTEDEFRAIIEDLEPRQQQELVALFQLGRGVYGLEQWEQIRTDAQESWDGPTAEYLLGHPTLAEDLVNGMALHGHRLE
ncbi:MAG: DUF3775 domain-containing protein [Thioalkalivibrio sp.]|nr:MAG: DUF3775 domain-containing protein [Thioalkalivibrio sp.]